MRKIFFIPLLIILATLLGKSQDITDDNTSKLEIATRNNTTIIEFKSSDGFFTSLKKLRSLKDLEISEFTMATDTPPNDSAETIIIKTIESDSGDIIEVIVKDGKGNIKRTLRVEEDLWDDFEDLFEDGMFRYSSDKIKIKSRKKNKNVETDWFSVDIGLNGFIHEGSASLPSSLSNLELDPLRSVHVNVGIFQQKINLYKHHVGFVYGVNYDNNDYRFSNDIDFRVTDDGDSISYLSRQTEGFDRNKLTTRFLTIPVALRFDFQPNKRRGGHITIGGHAGYRLTSFFKTVSFEGRDKNKTKLRDDFLLNNLRFGAYVKVGYKGFNLFGNYVFTPMFREGTAPVLNTFSFGLAFGGF